MKQRTLGMLTMALVIAAGVMISGCGEKMSTYRNDRYGFSIQYPPEWRVDEDVEGGAVVAFLSPQEYEADLFYENVNISVSDISNHPRTLDEYSRLAIRQMLAVFKETVEPEQEGRTTWAGRPAHRFSYVMSDQHDSITVYHIWTMVGTDVYTLTFTAETDKYEQFWPQAKRMIKSFNLKK